MTRDPQNRKLMQLLAGKVVPAFVAPSVMVSIVARLIPDRAAGRALGHAAFTTIAIPSALASLAVTVFLFRRGVENDKPPSPIVRSACIAAIVCGTVAALISVVLVSQSYVASRLFLDATTSAGIGGALASAQISRRIHSDYRQKNVMNIQKH